jgi:ankyrin repeat protein
MKERYHVSILILVLPSLLAINSCATSSKSLLKSVKANQYVEVENEIAKGTDVNQQTKWGYTPLMYASMWGCEGLVKLLIEEGADVNAQTKQVGIRQRYNKKKQERYGIEKYQFHNELTALMIAVDFGNTGVVSILIRAGADVNAGTYHYGYTSLMFAASGGYTAITKLLIDAGADVNYEVMGVTALQIALSKRYTDIAKLLIDAGAEK